MSDIKTWHQRSMAHPDHQSGMISEDMIRARMCEEIDDLRAEVERLRAMLPPTAHSGVRNGPGEGSWSVFAGKVVEERDAARAKIELLRADNEKLREMLLDIAVELRGEEPRIVFRIRKALEGKP